MVVTNHDDREDVYIYHLPSILKKMPTTESLHSMIQSTQNSNNNLMLMLQSMYSITNTHFIFLFKKRLFMHIH